MCLLISHAAVWFSTVGTTRPMNLSRTQLIVDIAHRPGHEPYKYDRGWPVGAGGVGNIAVQC